ncbi:MAG: HelD family protein [Sarcina sp.]
MTAGLKKEDEIQYLNATIKTINDMLASFGVTSDKQSNDIKTDRKHFWSNFSELDEIEIQNFNQDMAMQEKLYLKNKTKINTLQIQKNSPYFARMDFKENGDSFSESFYIGISSIMKDDFDFLVLDWRSPIANMFYDYEIGDAKYQTPNGEILGEITLNRQFNIKNGELKFIHESNSNLHDESLLEVLSSNTSDKMKNIVSSIQKKQNEIIRNDSANTLILQGCAGSGKTSIAMHRAAYLLYKHRKSMKADNILIFSPNDVFSDYISDVLPGLGEENIKQTTFEQFYRAHLPSKYEYEKKHSYLEFIYSNSNGDFKTRDLATKFKNSSDFNKLLEDFCSTLPNLLPHFNDIVLGGEIIIRKSKVRETFVDRFKGISYLPRIENLKESLISQVETKYLKQSKRNNASDFGFNVIDHGSDFNGYIYTEVTNQVDEMFKVINPVEIYKLFLNSITKKDFQNIDIIRNYTLNSLNELFVRFEDIVPILFIRCYMEGFRDFSNIQHIIIDECQDYSPLFYTIIKRTFDKASSTILGDLNQRISNNTNVSTKEDIYNIFDNSEVLTLTKSYRSTKNITDFAKNILVTKETVEAIDRNGLDVQLNKTNTLTQDIVKTINEMKSRKLESIAIIPKTAKTAKILFETLDKQIEDINLIIDENSSYTKGLTIIPSYIAKGLEFDGVIIPDADDSTYSLETERNLLYTVCTRALHELHIFYQNKLSKLIN